MEFPKFNGTDLKPWLYRCTKFFELDGIGDPQRVKLASIHLDGKVLLWHQTYIKRKSNVIPPWDQYIKDLTARFGDLFDDPMDELKNLTQTSTMQEYHDSFDALASRLNLEEEYLLSCYLGGLEEETQMLVRMFTPKTVQQEFCLAKLQEVSSKARKHRHNPKPALLPTPNPTKSIPTNKNHHSN